MRRLKLKGLYKAFGGHTASLTSQKAKFPSWIAAFKKPSSCAIERATFLAMWLSKYIFGYYPRSEERRVGKECW